MHRGVTLGQLFDELKRRNVIRVAVAYVVSAWLVLQVADVAINNIGAPEWVFSVFLLAGAVFFVPVLVFSWAYEITPEGVKKESEVDRSHSITRRTGRKLDLITIGMLIAVVAFVMAERTWFSQPVKVSADAPADATSEITTTSASEKSIAVLAFDDLSPEGDQAFFVEGLSEEILNVLAQVPGLKVAGRTSSFAFKDKDSDLREIGEALNVAHILEGSVRKAGNRIRVTAQLIQASDGFHLFSKTYDRDLTDVFAVQDDLAALIGKALQTELTGEDDTPGVAQTNIEAYDYYLLARQRLHSRSPELMTEAGDLLDRALAIDPNYAPALAQRALVWTLLSDGPGAYGDIPEAVAVEEGLASVTRALEIDPRLAEAHAILGLIVGDLPGRHDEGAASLRRALELNPNSDDGKVWLARITSDFGESVELNEQVVARNPLFGPAFNNLISLYNRNAEFDRSEALIDRVERISGSDINVHQARGEVALMRGELSEAVRYFDVAFAANPNGTIVRENLGSALFQLGDLERTANDGMPAQVIAALAELGDIDATDTLILDTDFRSGGRRIKLQIAADYLAGRGRAAEIVEIVNDNYANVATLLEELPIVGSYGTSYIGPLAFAFLQAGFDEEFENLAGAMKSALDSKSATGSDNWVFWISQAQNDILRGDADGAIEHLQAALDRGYAGVARPGAVFGMIEQDERYQSFAATALERANQERAKLGMGPYEPPLLLE